MRETPLAPPAETALVDAMSEDPPPSYRQRALAAILNIAAWIAIGPDRTSQLFFAPHSLCVDPHGDIYVAEVPITRSAPNGCHTLQKLERM